MFVLLLHTLADFTMYYYTPLSPNENTTVGLSLDISSLKN